MGCVYVYSVTMATYSMRRNTWDFKRMSNIHINTHTHTRISMLKTETIWFETLKVGALTYQRPAAVYWSGVTNKRKLTKCSISLS